MTRVFCEQHPSAEYYEDHHTGDLICTMCGLVLMEKMPCEEQDWRNMEDDKGKVRCDFAHVQFLPEKYEGHVSSTRAVGEAVPRYRANADVSCVKRWHSYEMRIKTIGRALDLPRSAVDNVLWCFKLYKDNSSSNTRTDILICACFFLVLERRGIVVPAERLYTSLDARKVLVDKMKMNVLHKLRGSASAPNATGTVFLRNITLPHLPGEYVRNLVFFLATECLCSNLGLQRCFCANTVYKQELTSRAPFWRTVLTRRIDTIVTSTCELRPKMALQTVCSMSFGLDFLPALPEEERIGFMKRLCLLTNKEVASVNYWLKKYKSQSEEADQLKSASVPRTAATQKSSLLHVASVERQSGSQAACAPARRSVAHSAPVVQRTLLPRPPPRQNQSS